MQETSPLHSLLTHAASVRRLARALVADDARADDVVQQAWLSAVGHPPHGGRGLRSWLTTVVRNAAWKLRREETRREAHERQVAPPQPAPSTAEVVAKLAAQRDLLDAVARLDEPDRSTLHARYFEERTPTEIAQALAIPVRTVETRLRRALERLRIDLDRRFPGGREAWAGLLWPLVKVGGPLVAAKAKLLTTLGAAAALVATTGTALVLTNRADDSRPESAANVAAASPDPIEPPPLPEAAGSAGQPQPDGAAPPAAERIATSLRVTVVTAESDPIAGAALLLFREDAGHAAQLLGDAMTDDRGDALLPIATAACQLLVVPRGAPMRRHEVAAGMELLEVLLDGGALLAGWATVDGAVPTAPLELTMHAGHNRLSTVELPEPVAKRLRELLPDGSPWDLCATTDARGGFAFHGLPPATRVTLHLPVPYEDARTGRVSVVLEEARDDVELRLAVNPSLRGRVVDRTGAALAGWRVEGWVGDPASSIGSQPPAVTDGDGHFWIYLHNKHDYPGASAWVYVLDPAGVPVRRLVAREPVGRGCDLGVVVVDRSLRMAIEAWDDTGAAVTPFRVVVESELAPDDVPANHRFVVVDEAPARSGFGLPERVASIRVVAAGFESTPVETRPAADPLRVTLPRAAELQVAVKEASGRSLQRSELEISAGGWPGAWTREEFVAAHGALGGSHLPWEGEPPANSLRFAMAKDGTFRAIALAPGIPLTLSLRDEVGVEVLREVVTLAAGEQRTVERTLAPWFGAVTGFVHDAGGVGLPQAEITWFGDEPFKRQRVRTGADGRFRIEDMRVRRATLAVDCAGHQRRWLSDVEVEPEPRELDIELLPGCTLQCRFIVSDVTRTVDDVWIEAIAARTHADGSDERSTGDGVRHATLNPLGSFEFADVPTEPSLLRARIGDFTYAYAVSAKDGAVAMNISARLGGPLEVSWKISEATAAGRSPTAVRLLPQGGFFRASATAAIDATDSARGSGVARFAQLPADRYRIAWQWRGPDGATSEELTDVTIDVGTNGATQATLAR